MSIGPLSEWRCLRVARSPKGIAVDDVEQMLARAWLTALAHGAAREEAAPQSRYLLLGLTVLTPTNGEAGEATA